MSTYTTFSLLVRYGSYSCNFGVSSLAIFATVTLFHYETSYIYFPVSFNLCVLYQVRMYDSTPEAKLGKQTLLCSNKARYLSAHSLQFS